MKKTFFSILIALMTIIVLGGFFSCNSPDNKTTENQEILIGALLPLTGPLAEKGHASLAAMRLAVDDFNDYLERQSIGKTVRLVYEDDATIPSVAMEMIDDLASQGIKLVVGPMASEIVDEVKSYAQSLGMILISQSSTATSLSVDDNVFRLVPDDAAQARALADLIIYDGRKAVVFIYRDDAWGSGLAGDVGDALATLGGTVAGQVSYRQKFGTAEQEEVNSLVNQAIGTYGQEGVAVQLISFSEGRAIIFTVAPDSILSNLAWYGSDGLTLDNGLLADTTAAQFAADVSLLSPAYRENDSTEYNSVKERVEQQLGTAPDIFAMVAYDALWIAGLALTGERGPGHDLKGAVAAAASGYEGITGTIQLNEVGDRVADAYDFWTISAVNGTYSWVRTVTWDDGLIDEVN